MSLGLIDGGRTDGRNRIHTRCAHTRVVEQNKQRRRYKSKKRDAEHAQTRTHDGDRSNRSFENLDIRGSIIALNAIRIYTREPYAKTIRYGAHTDEKKKK
jgi:hypothetical protein